MSSNHNSSPKSHKRYQSAINWAKDYRRTDNKEKNEDDSSIDWSIVIIVLLILACFIGYWWLSTRRGKPQEVLDSNMVPSLATISATK